MNSNDDDDDDVIITIRMINTRMIRWWWLSKSIPALLYLHPDDDDGDDVDDDEDDDNANDDNGDDDDVVMMIIRCPPYFIQIQATKRRASIHSEDIGWVHLINDLEHDKSGSFVFLSFFFSVFLAKRLLCPNWFSKSGSFVFVADNRHRDCADSSCPSLI